MARILRLPVQLDGIIIEACWACPFLDGSDLKNAHCNIISHFGLDKATPMEDGFELGCPLEEAPDDKQEKGEVQQAQNDDVPL